MVLHSLVPVHVYMCLLYILIHFIQGFYERSKATPHSMHNRRATVQIQAICTLQDFQLRSSYTTNDHVNSSSHQKCAILSNNNIHGFGILKGKMNNFSQFNLISSVRFLFCFLASIWKIVSVSTKGNRCECFDV